MGNGKLVIARDSTSVFLAFAARKAGRPLGVDVEVSHEPAMATAASVAAPQLQSADTASTTVADSAPLTEDALMQRLRSVASSQPALAVELAREGNRRFPDSHGVPERTSILVHALAALGRSSEARAEAETMVNHGPDSHWVREIEQFTGAHRHRNVRLDDAGNLEYF